jgi:SAM-dependent methyltransferase
MLEQARKIVGDDPRVTFLLNEAAELACCSTGQFDLVFSHICLQHMPWSLASRYLREFARVCHPGGWVAIQLPAREVIAIRRLCARARRYLVGRLPYGLGAAWRKWRHGTSVIFDMFYTLPQDVRATATAAGLTFCHAEPNQAAGENTEGFIYIFRKG